MKANLKLNPPTMKVVLLLLLGTFAGAKPRYKRAESVKLWASAWNGDTEAMRSAINAEADVNWQNEDDDPKGHTGT
jgi:hypothetical protein